MTAQITTDEQPVEILDTPSRARRRANELLFRKVLKFHRKGYNARRIAHLVGYVNISQGERDITNFLKNL